MFASKRAALRELAQWALGRRRLFRVRGLSMEPTLADGDFVLIDPHADEPTPGEIIVVTEPEEGRTVIKRVRSRGDHTVAVGSDNPLEGRDSRHFGSIDLAAVSGTVTLQVSRPRCLRWPR